MTLENEELLSPKEAADRMQTSLRSVQRWAKEKKIRSIRIGNKYKIPSSAVDEFVQRSDRE